MPTTRKTWQWTTSCVLSTVIWKHLLGHPIAQSSTVMTFWSHAIQLTYYQTEDQVQSFWLLWMMCRQSQLTKHTQYYIPLLSKAQIFLRLKEAPKCVCLNTYQWPAPCSSWSTHANCTSFSTTTDVSNRSMAHSVTKLTGNSRFVCIYFLSWSAYFVLVVSERKTQLHT